MLEAAPKSCCSILHNCSGCVESSDRRVSMAKKKQSKPIKILFIGNSFTQAQ